MPSVEQASRALFDAHEVLAKLKIPYILDGGTLLGFYRDGTFAKDDHDDIDLTVNFAYWQSAALLVADMIKVGFEVYHIWYRDSENHYSGQIAFKRDGVKIDVMFKEYKVESQNIFWTIYGGKRGVTYKAVPKELLGAAENFKVMLNLGHGKTGIINTGRPVEVEKYLEYRYGEWKIPVHRRDYSCYQTDKCIVEPNNYEAV